MGTWGWEEGGPSPRLSLSTSSCGIGGCRLPGDRSSQDVTASLTTPDSELAPGSVLTSPACPPRCGRRHGGPEGRVDSAGKTRSWFLSDSVSLLRPLHPGTQSPDSHRLSLAKAGPPGRRAPSPAPSQPTRTSPPPPGDGGRRQGGWAVWCGLPGLLLSWWGGGRAWPCPGQPGAEVLEGVGAWRPFCARGDGDHQPPWPPGQATSSPSSTVGPLQGGPGWGDPGDSAAAGRRGARGLFTSAAAPPACLLQSRPHRMGAAPGAPTPHRAHGASHPSAQGSQRHHRAHVGRVALTEHLPLAPLVTVPQDEGETEAGKTVGLLWRGRMALSTPLFLRRERGEAHGAQTTGPSFWPATRVQATPRESLALSASLWGRARRHPKVPPSSHAC